MKRSEGGLWQRTIVIHLEGPHGAASIPGMDRAVPCSLGPGATHGDREQGDSGVTQPPHTPRAVKCPPRLDVVCLGLNWPRKEWIISLFSMENLNMISTGIFCAGKPPHVNCRN